MECKCNYEYDFFNAKHRISLDYQVDIKFSLQRHAGFTILTREWADFADVQHNKIECYWIFA